jgi:ATP-dependent DNA helicase RecG
MAALPELRIGLVHGRLLADERDAIMDRFRRGELHVLCATTVIEVGVDVPNASLMVIEGADRFGLAQLHQLRGRIGRGEGASACLLLHDTPSELPEAGVDQAALPGTGHSDDNPLGERAASKAAAAKSARASEPAAPPDATSGAKGRLGVLARSSNGFHIAEADLRMRGPGEVLGTRQAGLPPLRYADLLRDIDLLQIARREAAALTRRDPELALPEHRLTRQLLQERWALADETTTLE